MRANIIVEFKRVKFKTIDEKILNEIPQIKTELDKLTKTICKELGNYFNKCKIKTDITYKLDN